jgi:hypothetical protein
MINLTLFLIQNKESKNVKLFGGNKRNQSRVKETEQRKTEREREVWV